MSWYLETICYDEMPCPALMHREKFGSASTWYHGMLYWKKKLKACPFLKGEGGEIDWGQKGGGGGNGKRGRSANIC